MDITIWKKIPGLRTRYEASVTGLIRRLSASYETTFRGKPVVRPQAEKILCGKKLSAKGYVRVRIDGNTYFAHRLIALAFIPNPLGLPQINHKNGIKTDNRPENLEWVTNQKNRDHAVVTGLNRRSLNEPEIFTIRSLLASGVAQTTIGKAYGVSSTTIWNIKHRRTWRHI